MRWVAVWAGLTGCAFLVLAFLLLASGALGGTPVPQGYVAVMAVGLVALGALGIVGAVQVFRRRAIGRWVLVAYCVLFAVCAVLSRSFQGQRSIMTLLLPALAMSTLLSDDAKEWSVE